MANGNDEDRRFLRKLNCNYLVLDEGHMLKNMQSQRYQGLMRMKVRCMASFTDGEKKLKAWKMTFCPGDEVLPIMAYTGRLRPKGGLFSGFWPQLFKRWIALSMG